MKKVNLLVNADDFGISPEVNSAVVYCFEKGLIERTSLMVNMDACENAVILSQKGDFFGKVGLHLNLVEGRPLTDAIKQTALCTEQGFFSEVYFRKPIRRFFVNRKVRSAIKEELEAQIGRYLSYGFTLKHIDSHQHMHTNPSVFFILYPLIRKYKMSTIRLSRNIPREEIWGIKGIYKSIFNYIVLKYNQLNGCESKAIQTLYFGSQVDVEKIMELDMYKTGIIEMETHPSVDEKGNLIDLLYSTNLEEWMFKLK